MHIVIFVENVYVLFNFVHLQLYLIIKPRINVNHFRTSIKYYNLCINDNDDNQQIICFENFKEHYMKCLLHSLILNYSVILSATKLNYILKAKHYFH